MSGTTSVPPIEFTNRGFVAPSEPSIVTGLDADWNAAFGGDLNTAPSTPVGQLIASEAAMLGDNYSLQAALYNGVDPAYASGRMQDAIARIYFLERNPAQSTVLEIACVGGVRVDIPVGATVKDESGVIYVCTLAGVIPDSGTITLPFASQVEAPFPVPDSVSIYQTIPGWNTATVDSGVVGNLAESRAAFEERREASVAANGAGFLPAVAGAVARVSGVIDYYVTENYTGAPVITGGVTLVANSLYVCVAGGAGADIAQAIWTKKNPGCAYTGNTTVVVEDSNSGYSPPYPAYNVTYEIPDAVAIAFLVTIADGPGVPANAPELIQTAISEAFLGNDGGTRARIGSIIYASRFYAPVALLGSWVRIVSILVGSNADPDATFTGVIAGTALTSSSVTGAIAIGQFVFGTGVADGTIVVSGSDPNWVVSISQTVSSTAMSAVAASEYDVTMDINAIPTLAPENVNVVLA